MALCEPVSRISSERRCERFGSSISVTEKSLRGNINYLVIRGWSHDFQITIKNIRFGEDARRLSGVDAKIQLRPIGFNFLKLIPDHALVALLRRGETKKPNKNKNFSF